MSDDKSKIGGQDRTRINTHQDHELQYWSEKFHVSEEELKAAVKASGSNEAEEVQRYLDEQ